MQGQKRDPGIWMVVRAFCHNRTALDRQGKTREVQPCYPRITREVDLAYRQLNERDG